jgi:hypothetical protein
MCSYHLVQRNTVSIAMSAEEEETVRELVLRNGGVATSPLDNLRVSSLVNISICGAPPFHYCIGVQNVGMGQVSQGQRLKESCIMFEEGV